MSQVMVVIQYLYTVVQEVYPQPILLQTLLFKARINYWTGNLSTGLGALEVKGPENQKRDLWETEGNNKKKTTIKHKDYQKDM